MCNLVFIDIIQPLDETEQTKGIEFLSTTVRIDRAETVLLLEYAATTRIV